jgi:AcrR family transcriptional regulator
VLVARRTRQQLIGKEPEETRQTILRTAQQFFMQYGYRAVTTRQLAEACGLTQPALYHHFSDKQELYLAVLTEEMAKIKAALDRIVRRSDAVPERLKSVASFLLSRVQYDLSLMLHDVRYEVTPDARDMLDQLFRGSFIAPITLLFEEGIHQGDIRSLDQGGLSPLLSAYLFMNMLSRFTAQSRNSATLQDLQAHQLASADLCVRILLYGLAYSR